MLRESPANCAICPLQNHYGHARAIPRAKNPLMKELPSPYGMCGIPPARAGAETHSGWLTNSTTRGPSRDEPSVRRGELMPREGYLGIFPDLRRSDSRIFSPPSPLRAPGASLHLAAGHAVPTRRELSARRVF